MLLFAIAGPAAALAADAPGGAGALTAGTGADAAAAAGLAVFIALLNPLAAVALCVVWCCY